MIACTGICNNVMWIFPGYVVTLMTMKPWICDFLDTHYHSQASTLLLLASLLPSAVVGWIVFNWWSSGWRKHPLAASLAVYAPNNSPDAWKSVGADVNTEYRRLVPLGKQTLHNEETWNRE